MVLSRTAANKTTAHVLLRPVPVHADETPIKTVPAQRGHQERCVAKTENDAPLARTDQSRLGGRTAPISRHAHEWLRLLE